MSWAGPDVEAVRRSTTSSSPPTTRDGDGGVVVARGGARGRAVVRDDDDDYGPESSSYDRSPDGTMTTTTTSSTWRPSNPRGSSFVTNVRPSRRPSPAEVEYDDLLDRTDRLLKSLEADDDSSSALRLMDFDEVMTWWSRFRSIVIVDDDDDDDGMGFLRRRKGAYDQCARLLVALEWNHDRLLDRRDDGVPSSSSSSSSNDGGGGGSRMLTPSAASYNLTLHALANSDGGENAAREARAILMRMLDRCRRYEGGVVGRFEDVGKTITPPPPVEPSAITMNSAIHAIARSGSSDAGFLAEEVFHTMERWTDECEGRAFDGRPSRFYRGVLPNARTLPCLIDAWANNARTAPTNSFAPERADAILNLAVDRRRAYVDRVTGRDRRGRECAEEGV